MYNHGHVCTQFRDTLTKLIMLSIFIRGTCLNCLNVATPVEGHEIVIDNVLESVNYQAMCIYMGLSTVCGHSNWEHQKMHVDYGIPLSTA